MSEKIDTLLWKLKEGGKNVSKQVKKSINDIDFRLLEQVSFSNKDNMLYAFKMF